MTRAELGYERADRDVMHWLNILAGSLSPAQRKEARLNLIAAVFLRAHYRQALKEVEREMVAV